ncbi:MAG TPA: hypothetical protein VLX85_02845 [Stellaceae bacterium]|nr:hypothetical protein [Stellaceae bacterium]
MTRPWQYQVRFDLNDATLAEAARCNPGDPALSALADVLAKHRVQMKNQFDAFAEYVAAAEE